MSTGCPNVRPHKLSSQDNNQADNELSLLNLIFLKESFLFISTHQSHVCLMTDLQTDLLQTKNQCPKKHYILEDGIYFVSSNLYLIRRSYVVSKVHIK